MERACEDMDGAGQILGGEYSKICVWQAVDWIPAFWRNDVVDGRGNDDVRVFRGMNLVFTAECRWDTE